MRKTFRMEYESGGLYYLDGDFVQMVFSTLSSLIDLHCQLGHSFLQIEITCSLS